MRKFITPVAIVLLCILPFLSFGGRKKITVFFEDNPTEVVTTANEATLYKGVTSVCIKEVNDNILHSQKELSSSLNVLKATVQKDFIKAGYIVKDSLADITIEIISIEITDLTTNTVTLDNGKRKTYECIFSHISGRPFTSAKVFMRVVRGAQNIHYTHHMTPCVNGCYALLDNGCRLINNKSSKLGEYVGSSKDPLPVELLGSIVSKYIIERIK